MTSIKDRVIFKAPYSFLHCRNKTGNEPPGGWERRGKEEEGGGGGQGRKKEEG